MVYTRSFSKTLIRVSTLSTKNPLFVLVFTIFPLSLFLSQFFLVSLSFSILLCFTLSLTLFSALRSLFPLLLSLSLCSLILLTHVNLVIFIVICCLCFHTNDLSSQHLVSEQRFFNYQSSSVFNLLRLP